MAGITASRKASARSKHTSRWPNAPVELPEARQVYMAGREADIMDFLVHAKDIDHAADYMIRCQHNRTLSDGAKLSAQLHQNVGAASWQEEHAACDLCAC